MVQALENMEYKELLKEGKKLQAEKSHLETELGQLQFQYEQLKRLMYGSKQERFIPNKEDENQLTLPFGIELETEPEKEQEVATYVRKKSKRKNHPSRLELPKHLPVEEITIELEEDTTGLKCIGKR